jgi:simple sugar transport system permease protein
VVEPVAIPVLSTLPVVGTAVFYQIPYVYGGVLLAAILGFGLARTRAGLRLRAVGESARAADAEGVSVVRVRLLAVLTGATLAGIAGSSLSLALSDTFSEGMTAGRGFIALAVVIFGRWSAWGGLGAALFFGAATALQFRLQARGLGVPYPVLLMLPYVVTLAVLALATGRARSPGDLGQAYQREES